MTENEAIKRIRNIGMMCNDYESCKYGHDCATSCLIAVDMAIKALEEIQAYRALGTVEEIKHFFNENRKAGYKHGYSDGYAKAIDEFAERLKTDYVNFDLYYILQDNNFAFENTSLKSYQNMIDEIAEEMKGGE